MGKQVELLKVTEIDGSKLSGNSVVRARGGPRI